MYWIASYPLDRVIHSLNNKVLTFTFGMGLFTEGWGGGGESLREGILLLKIGRAPQ